MQWITNIRDAKKDEHGYFGNSICGECTRTMWMRPDTFCQKCGKTLCYKCLSSDKMNCWECFYQGKTLAAQVDNMRTTWLNFKRALYDSFGSNIREAIQIIRRRKRT